MINDKTPEGQRFRRQLAHVLGVSVPHHLQGDDRHAEHVAHWRLVKSLAGAYLKILGDHEGSD